MPFQIRVFALNDVENHRDANLPCLYVMIQRIDRNGALIEKNLPDWAKCDNPVERPDLAPATVFHRAENARNKMRALVENLSSRGHTVNRCKTTYRLYVIELQPNPARDGDAKAVYVGETANTREARFQQHMAGGKLASREVAKRGIKLCPKLTPNQEYYTRAASKAAEKRLADRLSARGFKVYGGH